MASRQIEDIAPNRFAERLNAAIEARGISHRALAREIGASKQSVTNWTQGRNEPSLHYLRHIARALDTSMMSLLRENDRLESEGSRAASLMEELTSDPIGPAIRAFGSSAPDLLDLLSRAERYVKDLEEPGKKS